MCTVYVCNRDPTHTQCHVLSMWKWCSKAHQTELLASNSDTTIHSLFVLPVGLAGGSAPWVSSGTTWCYWSYSFSDQGEDGVCMCTACSYIISCQICGLFIVMSWRLYTLFIALNIDALQVIPCPDWCLWRVPVSILILIMLLVSMKIYDNFCGCTGTWKGKSAHLSVFPLCLEEVQFVQRVQRQVSCANASVNLSQINSIINK